MGILEGAISNTHNVEVAKQMRERCQILIAVGDCATFGGIVAMRNLVGTKEALKRAYLDTETTVGRPHSRFPGAGKTPGYGGGRG